MNLVKKEKEEGLVLHGNVTGHGRIEDSIYIHTSPVHSYHIDWEKEELVAQTRNSLYHCPLVYCRFSRQEIWAAVLPEYEKIKERYFDKEPYPEIEPGKILVVLSNFNEYYFHSLCYIPEGKTERMDYVGWPHVGNYQDSYLIQTENDEIDIRYFTHPQNIDLYCVDCLHLPWYVENIGDVDLHICNGSYVIKVAPGERKQICRENAEENPPELSKRDLYSACW